MKKRKLTKRQILNELLVVEEKKDKYNASLTRLYARGTKLDDQKNDLAKQLDAACREEAKKNGGSWDSYPDYEREPIIFKQHIFELSNSRWRNDYPDLEIKSGKSIN